MYNIAMRFKWMDDELKPRNFVIEKRVMDILCKKYPDARIGFKHFADEYAKQEKKFYKK